MNLLQFKKKAILSRKFHILLLGSEESFEFGVGVGLVNCNGIPFLCLVGGTMDVEAAAVICQAKLIESSISGEMTATMAITILQAESIHVLINPVFDLTVQAVLGNGKLIETIIGMDFESEVTALIGKSKLIAADLGMNMGLTVGMECTNLSSIVCSIAMAYAQTLTMTVGTAKPMEVAFSWVAALGLTAEAIKGVGKSAQAEMSFGFELSSVVTICDSKTMNAEMDFEFNSALEIVLGRIAKVDDYDGFALASMDGNTIESLGYIR